MASAAWEEILHLAPKCYDRPCAVIGQVPVQLETISPMVATTKEQTSIYIYKCYRRGRAKNRRRRRLGAQRTKSKD